MKFVKERLRFVAMLFVCMLILPILGISRYAFWQAAEMNEHECNQRRGDSLSLRGSLTDRDGLLLAYSQKSTRVYPYAEILGPLLGYFSPRLGTSGLENSFYDWMTGSPVPRTMKDAWRLLSQGDRRGDNVMLTLEAPLQKAAYEALSGYRGACVVMDVQTGELLALVSRPSYDPNEESLQRNWQDICSDSESAPLVERATQGLYPPGSTFKTVVLSAALTENLATLQSSYKCSGSIDVGNFILNCNNKKGHGNLSLIQAYAWSCNVPFAQLGLQLGRAGLSGWMRRFGFDDALPRVPGAVPAGFPERDVPSEPAEAAIGQADLLVTPLQMARVMACIARGGMDIAPHLLLARSRDADRVAYTKEAGEFPRREQVQIWKPEDAPTKQVMSPEVAAMVQQAARLTVTEGTGGAAELSRYPVCGKTGSAENAKGDAHAWFTGYAPASAPKVAVAVILENAGGGGRYAAPVAAEVLEAYFARHP